MGGSNQDNPVDHVLDALNTVSSKVVGYDVKAGRPSDAGALHLVDEVFGGITGRNAQRHAVGQAGDAVIAANKQANVLLAQQQEQRKQADIQASYGAKGIRETAAAQGNIAFNSSTTTPMAYGSKLGADTTDFLGV